MIADLKLRYEFIMSTIAELLIDLAKITGGGVVASTITLTINGWRQNEELRRSAIALSVKLVPVFDLYARSCASIRGKHLNDRYVDGYDAGPFESHWVASLPDAPALPTDDAGWRALSPTLAAQAQSFHVLVHAGKQSVFGIAEHGDAEDVSVEVERQAATLGAQAHQLAVAICGKYDLLYPDMPWDYALHFEEEHVRIEAYHERLRQMNSDM